MSPPTNGQAALVATATAAVVIAVLVVSAGLVPGFDPFPNGTPPPAYTEAQAAFLAQQFLRWLPGGPWQLASAEGFAFTNPNTFQLGAFGQTLSCSPTNASSWIVPDGPSSGDFRTGGAILWLLMYASLAPGGLSLLLDVRSGSAELVGRMPHFCLPGGGGFSLGMTLDSSVAMNSVLTTANGTRYSANFATSNVLLQLEPGSFGAIWLVYLSACNDEFWQPAPGGPPNGPGPTPPGVLFSAVSATNGTVLEQPLKTTSC